MRREVRIPYCTDVELQKAMNILAFEDGYRAVSPSIPLSRETLFCTLVPKDGGEGFPGSFPAARVCRTLETVRRLR